MPPRQQPKSFKAIKCWNIQRENEFRKDSAWVIQLTVWRQNQIVGHQIRSDDQANKKEETQEGFPIQFSTIQNQRKGCLHNFDSDSKYSVRTVSYNVRSGRSFRRHTRQSFSFKLAAGGPHSAFWFLSVLFWSPCYSKLSDHSLTWPRLHIRTSWPIDFRSSIDPRDSIQDLTEEERLALFRVGRRRRPTEFQLFSGPYTKKVIRI